MGTHVTNAAAAIYSEKAVATQNILSRP